MMRTLAIVAIIIILILLIWWVFSWSTAGAVEVNREDCVIQENTAYICPPEALDDFGPITVKDTASGKECTVSYRESQGFSFTGENIRTSVPPTNIAVAFLSDGSVSNIATTGASGSVAMHVNEDGTPDHVLTVNPNNETEQCFNSE